MPAYSDKADALSASLTALPAGTPSSEVARRLLDLFTSGEMAPGDRLPAERQLAATLQVGRSAVREALAALEILGIVQVRPGAGTYLRGNASELLPQTLRWGLLIGERNTAELLEMREGLEIYTARLAAQRADSVVVAKLVGAVDAMREACADLESTDSDAGFKRFASADAAFHRELAKAADNATLTDTLEVVQSLLRVYSDRAVHDAASAKLALDEHERVLAAVQAASADDAASAMAAHMTTAAERLRAG